MPGEDRPLRALCWQNAKQQEESVLQEGSG